ncbi:heterokaryon incompatibility protein-domain-containing protein [Xylariales sp. PMI_506]|nr:heterokaryon incompatibility protein-domain-containing protein [Xylariales sp. PMI_506]
MLGLGKHNKGAKGKLFDVAKNEQGHEEEDKDKKTVLCNGQKLQVFPNLYQALVELRTTHPGDYWIDAMCINQRDNDERKAQVEMMGRIYKAAESVTVWLGTCPAVWSSGVQHLNSSPNPDLTQQAEGDANSKLPGEPSFLANVGAIYILTRRWFKRLWTVQEVCLAQEIVFRLGRHRISPDKLILIARWVGTLPESLQPIFPIDLMTHIKNIHLVLNSGQFFSEGGKWSLEQWLYTIKGRRVGEARDIVYGGLSLINPNSLTIDRDLQLRQILPPLPPHPGLKTSNASSVWQQQHTIDNEPALWHSIRADYEVETPEVFLNIAACLLSQPKGLNGLLSVLALFADSSLVTDTSLDDFIGHDASLAKRIPSWVPNPRFWPSPKIELIGIGKKSFTACTRLPNDPRISADGRTLHVDVARLDVIEHVWSKEISCLMQDPFCLLLFLEQIKDFPKHYSPPCTNPSATLATFAHVIVAGRLGLPEALTGLCQTMHKYVQGCVADINKGSDHGLDRIPEKAPDQTPYLRQAKSKTDKINHLKTVWAEAKATYPEAPWPPAESTLPPSDESSLASTFDQARLLMMHSRTIFTTKSGSLGLGFHSVHPGDELMLIKGAEVPYIFRPVDEDLRLRAKRIQSLMKRRSKKETDIEFENKKVELDTELKALEAQIGDQNGWVAVGEAYVEGVMRGESDEEGMRFERLDIV